MLQDEYRAGDDRRRLPEQESRTINLFSIGVRGSEYSERGNKTKGIGIIHRGKPPVLGYIAPAGHGESDPRWIPAKAPTRSLSKNRLEEHDMLNWVKANRKVMNAGKMK